MATHEQILGESDLDREKGKVHRLTRALELAIKMAHYFRGCPATRVEEGICKGEENGGCLNCWRIHLLRKANE